MISFIISSSLIITVEPSEARGAFFFFFFAGSGALGIGGAQIPKLLAEFDEVKQLAGSFSKGGKEFPLSPVASFGYPEPVYEEDLQDVLDNMPTIKEIQEAGDKKSFMAAAGYLERDAFNKLITERAEGNVNKVALQCVFDALTGGGSTTLAPPQAFAEKMPIWKTQGLDSLASDLQKAQGKRLTAFAFFGFLLFVVFDLIIESGINGWAPQYFPGSF